jgi:hypothetical protein
VVIRGLVESTFELKGVAIEYEIGHLHTLSKIF